MNTNKPPRLPSSLFLKSLIIRTPLAGLLHKLRWLAGSRQRYRHPELWDMYLEEKRMPQVLQKLLKPDSCGIDVGGHVGSFLVMLMKIAPNGHHTVFEASPTKNAWLKRRFPDATVLAYAVADKAGRAVFQEDCARPGYSALSPTASDRVASVVRYEVETCCLDEVLNSGVPIDLIKLDIEGGELAALRGAKKTIEAWHPAIIFECGLEYSLDAQNSSRRELYSFISAELNYRIFSLGDFLFDRGEMSYDEFRKLGLYPFRGFNFVALPRTADERAPRG